MTVMFCSFDKQPLILRVYGNAEAAYPGNEKWNELKAYFPTYPGARQIFDLNIELVQTSCGFAVPYFDFKGERDTLVKWADNRGIEGIKEYWIEENTLSLDGKKTGIENDA